MANSFAKQLRQSMTHAEILLWGKLRRKQFGVRFNRQEPFHGYILDFCCHSAKLNIEVDGFAHNICGNDLMRDAFVVSQGWKVLRFTNRQIKYELDEVCEIIRLALDECLTPSVSAAHCHLPQNWGRKSALLPQEWGSCHRN